MVYLARERPGRDVLDWVADGDCYRAGLDTALVLSDLQGFSYQEIAEMTDVPLGTVKSRLHRARRAFQERWST